jgi:two-component system, NtrC family, response regulator AtoC
MSNTTNLSHSKILVVDDEEMLAWSISKELKKNGAEVKAVTTFADAILTYKTMKPDLVVCDIKLPDGSGLDLLKAWHESNPEVPVILMTAHGGIESAILAVKLRAFDYLQKPFQMNEMIAATSRAAEISQLRQKITSIEGKSKTKDKLTMIGDSPKMTKLKHQLERIAKSKTDTVLIYGETGTGKELAARAVNEWGHESKANFVEINCASIPPALLESELFGHERGAFTDAKQRKLGLFEIAGNGTLFLDEIGELPIELQPKLLRVLEQRSFRRVGGTKEIEFKGKIVAATNRDLKLEVQERRFRADLYYRLNVIKVSLPSLADRTADIPALAKFFMEKFSKSLEIPVPNLDHLALQKFIDYSWPGNIRELSNAIQRAMALDDSGTLTPEDFELDPVIVQTSPVNSNGQIEVLTATSPTANKIDINEIEIPVGGLSLEKIERNLLVQALERTQYNQSKAASLLNISRHTMRYRLEKHGLI